MAVTPRRLLPYRRVHAALACLSAGLLVLPAAASDWPEYLGGPDRSHFSPLIQIDAGNVTQLRVAWEHHTGEPGQMQCNPIVRDGVLYAVTATGRPFALDAATGRLLWRYEEPVMPSARVMRAVVYWEEGTDRRILFSIDDSLYAVDARTGAPIRSFGTNGSVSLRTGLGAGAQGKWVGGTSPGTVFENLIVMPIRVAETAGAAPGYIQAFDIRTGALAWVFRTIPLPGEFGYETWPSDAHNSRTVGGANSWPGMAVDRARGLVFVPTGSASPDFWGGRRLGQNLFANCLLALDARTGTRRWHFQFVHHDIWDRDLPAPPNLVTVRRDGRTIDAVAQITKSGHVFVFDRETGESLFPIDQVSAPAAELPGEQTWPTQPVPQRPAPFARHELGPDDISPAAENREELLAELRAARRGEFRPLVTGQGTVIFPGFDGGAEWGGAAVDPDGVLYVNANEMAWIASLSEAPQGAELSNLSAGHQLYLGVCVACHGPERKGNPDSGFPSLVDIRSRRTREEIDRTIQGGKGMMPGFPMLPAADRQLLVDFLLGEEKTEAGGHVAGFAPPPADDMPYKFNGYRKFLDSKGYPAITPPWGSLTAIDLNTGEHRWQITLGEFPELSARGFAPTGTENYGGPVVTASGLLFIAATKDGQLRAFDKRTGQLLWSVPLPAAGFATPTTYAIDGRQYLVIACGGSKLGTPSGDSYVAYALP